MAERIGDFLVRIGAMTPDQVKHILLRQQAGDKRRFGEIARSVGYVLDDAIRKYVDYMEKQDKDTL
jgi:hypothetical protein